MGCVRANVSHENVTRTVSISDNQPFVVAVESDSLSVRGDRWNDKMEVGPGFPVHIRTDEFRGSREQVSDVNLMGSIRGFGYKIRRRTDEGHLAAVRSQSGCERTATVTRGIGHVAGAALLIPDVKVGCCQGGN